jgi:hypothetical protein
MAAVLGDEGKAVGLGSGGFAVSCYSDMQSAFPFSLPFRDIDRIRICTDHASTLAHFPPGVRQAPPRKLRRDQTGLLGLRCYCAGVPFRLR